MKKRYIDKINSLFKLEIKDLVFKKQFNDHSIIICLKLRTPVLNYSNYHYFQYFINDKIGSIVITIGTYHRKMKGFISTKLKTFMKLIKSFGCNFWIKMIK